MRANTKRIQSSLGNKIQRLRKGAGLTQEELAEIVEISRTHMGHIEQGRKAPSLTLMEKLARALKVRLDTLFQ